MDYAVSNTVTKTQEEDHEMPAAPEEMYLPPYTGLDLVPGEEIKIGRWNSSPNPWEDRDQDIYILYIILSVLQILRQTAGTW